MTKLTTICLVCGKEMPQSKSGNSLYCSKECRSKSSKKTYDHKEEYKPFRIRIKNK